MRTDRGAITVRRICRADVPGVRVLDGELFPVHYEDSFYNSLDSPSMFTWVAVDESNGEVIGVASGRFAHSMAKDETAPPGHGNSLAYLCTLGVDKNARRLGLGTELLSSLTSAMSGAGATALYLHVRADNFSALDFYRRVGMVIHKRISEYYRIPGEPGRPDAYVMFSLLPMPNLLDMVSAKPQTSPSSPSASHGDRAGSASTIRDRTDSSTSVKSLQSPRHVTVQVGTTSSAGLPTSLGPPNAATTVCRHMAEFIVSIPRRLWIAVFGRSTKEAYLSL